MIGSEDLIKLASNLLEASHEEVEQAAEALVRASASRAYYAAYHTAKTIGDKLPQGSDGGVHQRMIDGMINQSFSGQAGLFDSDTARKIVALGYKMNQIKAIRFRADYALDQAFEIETAQQAIAEARQALKKAQEVKFID